MTEPELYSERFLYSESDLNHLEACVKANPKSLAAALEVFAAGRNYSKQDVLNWLRFAERFAKGETTQQILNQTRASGDRFEKVPV